MRKCFIMHRTGVFYPFRYTKNQCKVKGHISYNYHAIILFPGSVVLDQNSFIIDHFEIDKVIQDLYKEGSCEEMTEGIGKAIMKFFKEKEIKCNGCKIIVHPEVESLAFMEFITSKSKEEMNLLLTIN